MIEQWVIFTFTFVVNIKDTLRPDARIQYTVSMQIKHNWLWICEHSQKDCHFDIISMYLSVYVYLFKSVHTENRLEDSMQ